MHNLLINLRSEKYTSSMVFAPLIWTKARAFITSHHHPLFYLFAHSFLHHSKTSLHELLRVPRIFSSLFVHIMQFEQWIMTWTLQGKWHHNALQSKKKIRQFRDINTIQILSLDANAVSDYISNFDQYQPRVLGWYNMYYRFCHVLFFI